MPEAVIAWDTCVLLDAMQPTASRWDRIAPILNLAVQGDLKIVLSTLSVAEAFYLKTLAAEGMAQADQNDYIEKWLEHKYLVKRAADFGTCKIAAELCRQANQKLDPPDAIIIATAIRHNAATLLTYDNKKNKSLWDLDQKFPLANGKMLRICPPEDWAATCAEAEDRMSGCASAVAIARTAVMIAGTMLPELHLSFFFAISPP